MKLIKILWAEDDIKSFQVYAEYLKKFLRKSNIQAEIKNAKNGDAVYRHLSEGHYDLLVSDIEMPEWDGIDTVTDINKKYSGLPMLIVSTHTENPDFIPTLKELVLKKIIIGYYSNESRKEWCNSILKLINSEGPNILHISDLHFGDFHVFKQTLSIEKILIRALEKITKNKIDLLIVSGDLTSKGLVREFERAGEFLNNLIQYLEITSNKVIIVPGNHDIHQPSENSNKFLNYIQFLNDFYTDKFSLMNYPHLFDSKIEKLVWKRHHNSDSIFHISIFDCYKIIVLGLNSVISDDTRYKESQISPNQLINFSDQIEKLQSPRSDYFRLAVFHHNLFIVPNFLGDGEPERIIRNQGLVLQHLTKQKVQLIFHGHTHYSTGYNFIQHSPFKKESTSFPINVIATGTLSGNEPDHSQHHLHLALVKLEKDSEERYIGSKVTPYKIGYDQLDCEAGTPYSFSFYR